MAEIISIDEKRLFSDKEKVLRLRKRKLLAVRKLIQCTHCQLKCEKCGSIIEREEGRLNGIINRVRVPYRFCDNCSEEYVDFVGRLSGNGDPDYFWHNESWLKSWQAWIDYKGALDEHVKSKEFRKLLKDLEESDSQE
jgi:hypothetical protein